MLRDVTAGIFSFYILQSISPNANGYKVTFIISALSTFSPYSFIASILRTYFLTGKKLKF